MLRRLSPVVSVLCVLAVAAGCGDPGLKSSEGRIAFAPAELNLGSTWQSLTLEKTVRVTNLGKSPVTLEWTAPAAPFELVDPPGQLDGSQEREVTIRFLAGDPGSADAKVTVRTNAGNQATLSLRARSDAIPECPKPQSCHAIAFDLELGRCVETPTADGAACDPHSVCVTDATCQAGSCVGKPIACDDGNACTLNVCDAVAGCQFPPAPPCPGDGVCQVGTCDPQLGCGLTTAPDGTACGQVACDAAQICIAGVCETRDPPDGFVCAEASPCQGEGLCQGNTCVRASATELTANWSYDASAFPDGGFPDQLHDMVVEPTGEVSLLGFFEGPRLRANTANAVEVPTFPRRCIGWNGGLACADFGPSATVASLAFDGTVRWTFNLSVERPDVAAANDNVFMARVAAMGSDRLLAIFETYPKDSDPGTLLRGFYLVALDSQGSMVWMQELSDPLLDQDNHPHPYGVAADGTGNVYLAFSSSFINPNVAIPLAPQLPTLLMSYSHDGQLRWARTENVIGGELAVADGLLFTEWDPVPRDTETGLPIAALKQQRGPMGRAVATHQLYVTSPLNGGGNIQTINAFDHTAGPKWSYALPPGESFLTRELQLVRWQSRPERPAQDAVLTFVARFGVNELVALKVADGSELWRCPLEPADAPQTIAVSDGSFTVMSNASTCGACDPPFANSSARFWQFATPGLSLLSDAPWPGTFGGPLHDHLEKALPVITPGAPN